MRDVDKVTRTSLVGIWRRSLLAYPDGRRDETSDVTWVQGPSLYGDLRQPRETAHVAAACLRDLDLETIAVLAGQDGFAGVLVAHESHFEWLRLIDFHPKGAYADRGTLTREGDLLVERGLDLDYCEHWHRQSSAPTPVEAMLVREAQTDCTAIFLRVGGLFFFARDRRTRLAPGGRLSEHTCKAASLEIAQDLVDCEISIGSVEDGWRIIASTLPWRCGGAIAPRREGGEVILQDVDPNGTATRRRWAILKTEACA